MTFEETYPRYPFSELVRLSLVAGKGVLHFRSWAKTILEHRPATSTEHTKAAA